MHSRLSRPQRAFFCTSVYALVMYNVCTLCIIINVYILHPFSAGYANQQGRACPKSDIGHYEPPSASVSGIDVSFCRLIGTNWIDLVA